MVDAVKSKVIRGPQKKDRYLIVASGATVMTVEATGFGAASRWVRMLIRTVGTVVTLSKVV